MIKQWQRVGLILSLRANTEQVYCTNQSFMKWTEPDKPTLVFSFFFFFWKLDWRVNHCCIKNPTYCHLNRFLWWCYNCRPHCMYTNVRNRVLFVILKIFVWTNRSLNVCCLIKIGSWWINALIYKQKESDPTRKMKELEEENGRREGALREVKGQIDSWSRRNKPVRSEEKGSWDKGQSWKNYLSPSGIQEEIIIYPQTKSQSSHMNTNTQTYQYYYECSNVPQ